MTSKMTSATEAPMELGSAFFDDPHGLYARLREQRPVLPVVTPAGLRVWLVTRYDDVRAALNDPRLGKDSERFSRLLDRHLIDPNNRVNFADSLGRHMLSADPPDHTRLRRLVSRAFTARSIAALQPRIEAITDDLVDAMAERVAAGEGELDLIDHFAFPLPMTVIAELLGVPEADRGSFRGWSNLVLSQAPPEQRQAAVLAMAGYLAELIARKRAEPGEDMLSVLAAEESGGADSPDRPGGGSDQLSESELLSMAFLLLVAGHETTVNLISNGMLALLRHPDRLAVLRAEPDRIPQAVEEFLRFDGPLNTATFRHTLEPVTISGVRIPAEELVLVALASANRDPSRFPCPDDLDLDRDAMSHLAFGYGIHYCLGAPLARLEGEVAFRALLARFPSIELAIDPAELSWRASILIHGVDRLPLRLAGVHQGKRRSGS